MTIFGENFRKFLLGIYHRVKTFHIHHAVAMGTRHPWIYLGDHMLRTFNGRRRYVDHTEVPRVHGGTGTAIISTSAGVMTGHEAKQKRVGGEVVAYVW